MPLDRDQVVWAAVELLDEVGLDKLTLRALGERLGVAAPTLYWHVRNKRHLLDLVAIAVLRRSSGDRLDAPTPGQPWWEWLAVRCRHMRAVLLAHRDSALVVAGNRPTPDMAHHVDRTLAVLVAAGFSPPEALRCMLALGTYVTGDVLETQRSEAREPDDEDTAREREEALTSGDHPTLAAAAVGLGGEDERFEEGLALMIDGMRARVGALGCPADPERPAGATPAPPG